MTVTHWDRVKKYSTGVLVAFLLLSSACSWINRQTYNDGQLRQAQAVYYGTIVNVSEVEVTDEPGYLAPVVGGVLGGAVGVLLQDVILPGSGVTILAGAAAGAMLGGANNMSVKKRLATELTITLENGSFFVAIINSNHEYFLKNDSVRIIFLGDGLVRIQHVN